jgi:hypothetical protein
LFNARLNADRLNYKKNINMPLISGIFLYTFDMFFTGPFKPGQIGISPPMGLTGRSCEGDGVFAWVMVNHHH